MGEYTDAGNNALGKSAQSDLDFSLKEGLTRGRRIKGISRQLRTERLGHLGEGVRSSSAGEHLRFGGQWSLEK